MAKATSLKEIVSFNTNFKSAINLYLSLNKPEKVLSYIPTNSSLKFLGEYLDSVLNNKEQASLLVGPYGKGKSHLLLVLLAVLSMERNKENKKTIDKLIKNVRKVDETGDVIAEKIISVWNKERFLPVLISNSSGDLNQAFLYGLSEALKRENLSNLAPETYFSIAIDRIAEWKKSYKETYSRFENAKALSLIVSTEEGSFNSLTPLSEKAEMPIDFILSDNSTVSSEEQPAKTLSGIAVSFEGSLTVFIFEAPE